MPLDPLFQMMADNATATGQPTSLAETTVEDARNAYLLMVAAGGEPPALASIDDRRIPGPDGDMAIRVYRPNGGEAPRPVVVYYHGGGFTIGSIETHDPVCRTLAAQAEALVVSVEYRLAPEHPFPAATDDAFAALQWVGEHAAEIGGDPSRIAVAGDSAGGNLAAVSAIAARDAGGPAVCFQALVYPTTDAKMRFPSIDENGEMPILPRRSMEWFYEQYKSDVDDWRATPIDVDDLSGLPPAVVITAEYDPLRDEGEAYGEKLRAAGVPVTGKRYDGMAHAFVQMLGVLEPARDAMALIASELKRAFGTA
ncbi:MAG TPA: alpha/beta hydrolase [Acidimicrobiales bacterium]|nr:alpha/beta hydrolase [Acidimicrobiales bacterium]